MRNLKLPIGEIDAICVDRGRRLLVEVRASSATAYPLDSIGHAKHDQLRKLANFVGVHRVDVVGVGVYGSHVVFHWNPDAV